MFESVQQLGKSRKGIRRRMFLFAAAAGAGGVFVYRWWRRQPMAIVERPVRYVTPNRDFYTVSINLNYPAKVDPGSWKLELKGPGGDSRSLALADLAAMDVLKIHKTFMCISNRVGGDAIGNAEWTAVALAPILEPLLGAARDGLRVAFYGMDGFYSSVPLPVALDPETYLAWEMNGVPLPREHGFPLRVLITGKYGMKQPRWLERIEVTRESVSGYWENRGWSDSCQVRMTSRIDSARRESEGVWRVAGIAYCGGLPVGRVELSDDDGKTWREARLTSPAAPNAWSTWEWEWNPAIRGGVVLTVRVVDSAGDRQIEDYSGSFPSGSTGLHRVIVRV